MGYAANRIRLGTHGSKTGCPEVAVQNQLTLYITHKRPIYEE
jgi:hypothetical protein